MFKYTLSLTIEIEIVRIHRCLLGVDLSHMCILVCLGKSIALAKGWCIDSRRRRRIKLLGREDGNGGAINL
jgi:hypothetical protein